MEPIKEITVTKKIVTTEEVTLPTACTDGLRFAVVYDNRKVIALFDDTYWAQRFVGKSNMTETFTVLDITTGEVVYHG